MLRQRAAPRPIADTRPREPVAAARHTPQPAVAGTGFRPTYLARRRDSTTPREAPVHDTPAPSSAPPRPRYLRAPDPALREAARTGPPEVAAPTAAPAPPAATGGSSPAAPEAEAARRGDAGEDLGESDGARPEGAEENGTTRDAAVGTATAGTAVDGESATPRGGASAPDRTAGPAAHGGRGPGLAADEGSTGVPLPETGTVFLPQRPLVLPPASQHFDAPRSFALKPIQPIKDRTPDIDRYAALFGAAIESAARFAADLVADAARDADVAQSAESRRAAARQQSLDATLTTLDRGLEQARATLAAATHRELMLIDRRAGLARMRIGGAAERAHDRRTSEIATITVDTATRRLTALGIQLIAQLKLASISTKAENANHALHTLGQDPTSGYPLDGSDTKVAAQNEAIVARLPPRTTDQEGATTRAAESQVRHLQTPMGNLGVNITNAFQPFEGMLTALNGPAKEAVDRARNTARRQVRDVRKALRQAVEQGRASAETALVQQHDLLRRQLIEAARTRAEQERIGAERSVAQRIGTATGIAGSQAATVRAVIAGLEPERRRAPGEFATVVVRAARNLQERIDQAAATQRPKLTRSTPQTMATLDDTSTTTSTRMQRTATENAERFNATAAATGEAFLKQIDEGTACFANIAQPVAQSIVGYIDPIHKTYADELADLDSGVADAGDQIRAAFAGQPTPAPRARRITRGAPAAAPATTAATTPATPTEAEGPDPSADAFLTRADGIAADARTEGEIAAFADRARGAVHIDVQNRANTVYQGLKGFWGPDVEQVMTGLRGLTRLRANYLRDYYANVRPKRDIVRDVTIGLSQGFKAPGTKRHNREAAVHYLNGDPELGALSEMQAAVNLWNDDARVERVMRSLTPAQMTALSGMPSAREILADIEEDLGGKEAEVFAALRSVTNDDPSGIGRANAIRLEESIDRARKTAGTRGEDRTVDAIVDANRSAGADRLSGADEFPQLEREGAAEERRRAVWQSTVAAFATRHPLAAKARGPPDDAAALTAYATGTRRYEVWVQDTTRDYGLEDRRAGVPRGHVEVRHVGIEGHNRTLIDNVVRHGYDSAEARGARMAVEMTRPGGPNMERLALATADDALNPGLTGTSPAAERRRADALRKNDEALSLYWQYTHPNVVGPPPPPSAIRSGMTADLNARLVGDPAAAAQAGALLRDPRAATDRDYALAAVAGFNYALSRSDVNVDALRRTFRSLSFDQAELANRLYNQQHPGGPSLYARLGIRGEGDYLGSIIRGGPREGLLSGDEALEIERESIGTPTTDRERFALAVLTARQQIRESGWLGRLLASEEYGNLKEDYANLLRVGGVSPDDVDHTGILRMRDPRTHQQVRIGRFDERGTFIPPTPGSTEEFEVAMDLAKMSAQTYTMATDRIAAGITIALLVVAAVVTTVLTAGAAASIWIPVLVTAGAGLVGMGLTASIKGGRYSRDEMARDLAMTIITAATAGLGAAAGTALRGGLPALRAAAGSLRVSEGAMRAALTAGGRQLAMRTSLTLFEEMAIGGVTSGLNSMGGALVDPAIRRSEDPAGEVLHSTFRGLLGGVAGSAAMRPFARFARSDSPATRAVGRAAGQGLSGAGSRATEIAYERARGTDRRAVGEQLEDIAQTGLTQAFQGFTESHAEDRGRAYFGRRETRAEARTRAAEERRRAESGLSRGDTRRPVSHPGEAPLERPAAARFQPEGEPAKTAPPRPPMPGEPAASRPVTRVPAPEPIETPRPTPASSRPDDEATQRIIRPAATTPDEETTQRIVRPAETRGEETKRLITQPAAHEETEPTTRRRPRAAPSDEQDTLATHRRPRTQPGERDRPPRPGSSDAQPEEIQLDVGDAMMPPDPRSRGQAMEMFQNNVRDDPHRECAVYRNSVTGEHVIIQGNETRVFVDRDERGNPIGVLGEGNPQRWKEILDGGDRGEWLLVAHNHPGEADASAAGWATRLPSGRGGDFSVMMHESALAGGETRYSSIHVTHEGRTSVTEFAYDPGSPRPFAIIYDDPATGQRVFRRFASLEAYGEFFENLTGISPHVDTPGSPAASPPTRTELGPAPAGRGRSPYATGGGPGDVTPLKPTPDNPSARTDNCGFCAISHALFAETGVRPPRGADGLHAAATERLQSRTPTAIEPPPHTLYAEALPRGTTDLTAADLRAARGPVGGAEGVFGPGDWTLAGQAEAAGLRVNRKEPSEIHRGAEFLNPQRQAEHVEAAARRRAAARGADFDDLSEQQQDAMRAAARDALAHSTASVPGNYIAHVGQRNGGDHFVNVSIDANGNWTTYDPQSGLRSTGPPAAIQRLWKVSAPDIPVRGSGGEGGGLPPVPASAARPARTPEGSGPAAAARPRAAPEEATARTRAHDVEDLFAEVQAELDRPAAPAAAGPAEGSTAQSAPRAVVPPPEAGPLSQPTLERLQAGARRVADAALAEMRAARGVEAARQLEELILLAPGVMMGRPETEIPATSRGPRWRVGLLDANSETIRDRRFAELPGALGQKLVLDPPSRERLAALLRARRAAARPGESRSRRAAEVEATIARWERQGMNRRELRAYEAQAHRLETYAGGEAGFGTARRARMQAEEDALRGTVDQRMRRAPAVRERDLLRQILRGTGEDWLAAFARGSMPFRGTRGWDVIEQWHAYLDNVAANNRANPRSPQAPSQQGFERYMRRYMKGTQRPRLSELAAAEGVSQRAQDVLRRGPGDPPPPGLEMLKIALDIDLDTRRSRNEPSEPGTDYLGLRPGDGVLVYGDDKAHQATLRNRGAVEEVEAYVPGLARNMRDDAEALETRFAALRERGLAVEDRHAAVPERLRACAAALEAAFPRGINLRGRRAQARFRRILAQHKVELIVTAAAVPRGVDRVAPRLARAGVRFLPLIPRRALEEDEEPGE